MSPLIMVAIALAVSMAANLGLTHLWLGARDDVARAEQSYKQVDAAAKACTVGVDVLKAESDARQAAVLAALEQVRGAANRLQLSASKALAAKPDDPKDLCGSLQRYLQAQIVKERANP